MLLPKIIYILTTVAFVSGIWTCDDDTSCYQEIIKTCECFNQSSYCCRHMVDGSAAYSVNFTYNWTYSGTLGRLTGSRNRVYDGVLNVFYHIQERCGKNNVNVMEVEQVYIMQGGKEFCDAEVKWMFQGTYNKTQTEVELPFGVNFTQPGQYHLNLTGYDERFKGGPPYLPVKNATSTFLERFRTDKKLEPLEVSRGRTLEDVMNIYNGRNIKTTSLPLKYINGTSLPKEGGFLFQQVGICNHRRLPDWLQFIVYTDNLRVMPFPSMDRGMPSDKFVEYETYTNDDSVTKTYIRYKIRNGLSILNSELARPKTALVEMGDIFNQLKSKFRQVGKSNVTGINWSGVAINKWELKHEIDRPLKVSVPAGTKVVFYVIEGHFNGWIYTWGADQYEIIRDGCSIEAVGFHLGHGPTERCDSKDLSCTPQEKYKRTKPKMVANPKSKGRNFIVEYAVGTVDYVYPSAKISDLHHGILRNSFSKLGVGPLTTFPWNKLTVFNWPWEVLERQNKDIFVPSGLVAEAYQVVGICGYYRVFTKIVHIRYLSYNAELGRGDKFVNGTGPFENPGFHLKDSDFLND